MRDAARLLGYVAATVLFGALAAPWLFWSAQAAVHSGIAPWLAKYDFETFFHRALLVGALLFLWPLLASLKIRSRADLGLQPNRHWLRDAAIGFLLSAIPVLCAALVFISLGWHSLRTGVALSAVISVALAAVTVPFIEESLFRGLLFGIFLRARGATVAIAGSAALFSILHFLKAPPGTSAAPAWYSGFVSIAHAFNQFGDPMLLLAGFTTLLLIGCILAHARFLTRSLWLPIGLHSGWIFASGEFAKFSRRGTLALPWLGKNLLIGIIPLGIAAVTWGMMLLWIRYAREHRT